MTIERFPPRTVGELIVAFGGNIAIGEIAGVRSSAVSNWRRNGAIPPRLYLTILDAARHRGIDVPPALFREVPESERSPAVPRDAGMMVSRDSAYSQAGAPRD